MIPHPETSEFAPYYAAYIALVPGNDIVKTVAAQGDEAAAYYLSLTEDQGGLSYAPGKWTIKQVLGHVIDTERIISYRALRIARGDQTNLPGFEQDDYVATANSSARTMADLAAEFQAVRHATGLLLKSFPDEAWQRRGFANNNEVTVRALAYILTGHEINHRTILQTRYLPR